jgi:hypothetical protein
MNHESKPDMTIEEFKKRVYEKKQSLCVVDNQVVKIAEYEHFHPGGTFTLKKNYGRDVSKYFIGAYKLANQVKNERMWNHSAGAVAQVNGMVIANLVGQKGRQRVTCEIEQLIKVNSLSDCMELKACSEKSVKDWCHWYESVDMIGRHFLIYSKKYKRVKRQYTVCNSMQPDKYNLLIQLCKGEV